ncbi:hypothetical protein BOX15_Mlig019753g1 [Macrostomum lignano]|uniref:Amino acid transporter transmembrane domain-containing protein n=1 Tax=Macrostomum lignano TaxID=282301 RepID=A0A267EHF9_9PLAT|nr:hypothetical protein BOX15_Mlig019753g1 [Macrostomum lignano]
MVSALQHVSDFANLFKAFIGSNYLSMPFAFSQSGLALGFALLMIIAVLTDHCCYLIVTCKQLMVESLVNDEDSGSEASLDGNGTIGQNSSSNNNNSSPYYYNDGFCPDALGPGASPSTTNTNNSNSNNNNNNNSSNNGSDGAADDASHQRRQTDALHRIVTLGDIAKFTYGRPGLWLVNASLFITQFGFCINYFIFIGNTLHQVLSLGRNDTDTVAFQAYDYHTQAEQQNSDLDGFTETPTWSVPPLWLLVCAPLPLFLGFALIRNIRSMGSVSVVANISICAGVVAVLAVMLHQFSVSDTVQQATGATLPVYIGMVAVSYEGIGTVIPIESSMEDNRHNFRSFLRGSLVVVTAILGGVGTIGYLRYGQDTRQIVVQNLPTQSLFVVILDATLILGVIFTFPLQIYPVIQMTEKLFLARYSVSPEEQEALIASASVQLDSDSPNNNAANDAHALLSTSTPDGAPTWMRNCLRFGIVMCQLAMAILLRKLYAYVSSFIGAVGSIFLAFVLPCAAHLRLVWHRPASTQQRLVLIKDATICGFGCLASITSLFVTLAKIFEPHFFG